jgi:type II secretory pathway pseudopilin PulG
MRLITVAVLSTAALAALTAVSPASAQAPQRRSQANNTERVTFIDQYGRRTTRITVRPRSFLDPGTATKPGSEHFTDYVQLPQTYPGEYLSDRYDWKQSWSRMPFPSCVDLPSYCR